MRFFLTVGTTPFPRLTNYIIDNFDKESNDITLQSACSYKTDNINCFDFTDDISYFIDNYDLIITHAGAGSIYSLLEKGKKLIVVPNLDRDDKHQSEISKYIEKHNFALVCWDLDNLKELIAKSEDHAFNKYHKNNFFKFSEIKDIIYGK